MKILNAKLRGFIGVKKGMGLDEIEVDLSSLSGLVALAGPNGHGKTTLLENLSPYRGLASRKGPWGIIPSSGIAPKISPSSMAEISIGRW